MTIMNGHMTIHYGHVPVGFTMSILQPILSSENGERVLVFLTARNEGYAREIARFFNTDLSGIQMQLEKLETGGVLVSRRVGRTRLYAFNLRYPFRSELTSLLEKAISYYPEPVREGLLMNRRRPRHPDKPL